MTTAFELGRAPIDTTKNVARLLLWPLHVGETIATNVVDTAFQLTGTKTIDDAPSSDKPRGTGESIYDMTTSNLDLAGIIYYYTELRVEARRQLKKYAEEKGISYAFFTDKSTPSDLTVLSNGFKLVEERLAILKSSPEAPGSVENLQDYQDGLEQLQELATRFGLDDGDMEIFKTYFSILSEPKSLADMKSDAILFDNIIDPKFRFAFGGSEFNRRKITEMIESNKNVYLHHIDDDFTTKMFNPNIIKGFQSEVVWAIVVCDVEKTITVVFRGSVSGADWVSNVQCNMVDFMLPGFTSDNVDVANGTNYGRVHEGFYEYLFEKTSKGSNGSVKSKGEEIIGMLKADFFDKEEYQDYSLNVTGHSLGGALSTMFAFRAATENDEGGRKYFRSVTNVSFASPFVGDQVFRNRFYDLERNRRIRHLRISNNEDPVPLIPACTLPLPSFSLYKHVGVNIRLYKEGDFLAPSYRRFYPKMGSVADEVRNGFHSNLLLGLSVSPIENHLCPEYDKRLQNKKLMEELSNLYLDEMYGNKDITGWDFA